MRSRILVLFSLTEVLVGCQSQPPDETKVPLASLESGTRVALHVPVAIPPERNRIYFQSGRPVPVAKLNANLPYCALETAVVRSEPWEINEDDFIVAKVRRSSERLADDSGSARAVVFVLRARLQPEINKMVCGRAKSAGPAPVTIAEWREIMGGYFRMR